MQYPLPQSWISNYRKNTSAHCPPERSLFSGVTIHFGSANLLTGRKKRKKVELYVTLLVKYS
jgi:hypothetical protein